MTQNEFYFNARIELYSPQIELYLRRVEPVCCVLVSYLSSANGLARREHGFPSRRPEEYKLWRRTFRHLKRDDVKQSIKEYEQLLLDSHSTRKGATNAGAQGGLLQESCDGSRAECTSYSGMLAIPLEALF